MRQLLSIWLQKGKGLSYNCQAVKHAFRILPAAGMNKRLTFNENERQPFSLIRGLSGLKEKICNLHGEMVAI